MGHVKAFSFALDEDGTGALDSFTPGLDRARPALNVVQNGLEL